MTPPIPLLDGEHHSTQRVDDRLTQSFSAYDYASLKLQEDKDAGHTDAWHTDATIVSSNQQPDERPFYEAVHGPAYYQSSQYLDNSNLWYNANSLEGQQPGVSSFGTYFDVNSTSVPNEDLGLGASLAPSARMSQPTVEDFFPFHFQVQPVTFGGSGAQPPASAGFVIAPAPAATPAPTPVSQANVGPRHHCPLGCAKSFRRPGDYRRHMKKHDAPRYKCAVMDCDKTFYRADKLRAHLKQGHKFTL